MDRQIGAAEHIQRQMEVNGAHAPNTLPDIVNRLNQTTLEPLQAAMFRELVHKDRLCIEAAEEIARLAPLVQTVTIYEETIARLTKEISDLNMARAMAGGEAE